MRDCARSRALVPGMRLGESWNVGAWVLGEAWRFVGVLRCNRGVGAQQEAKLKFGNCKNEQRHWELLSGKGITGCGVREEGD